MRRIRHRVLKRAFNQKTSRFYKNKKTYKKILGIQSLTLYAPKIKYARNLDHIIWPALSKKTAKSLVLKFNTNKLKSKRKFTAKALRIKKRKLRMLRLRIKKRKLKAKALRIKKRKLKFLRKSRRCEKLLIKPYLLTLLGQQTLEKESILATYDVERFTHFATPEVIALLKEIENFKYYLPKNVWNKMSGVQKQSFLKRRRELQAQGFISRGKDQKGRRKYHKRRNIFKRFSYARHRPLLSLLNPKKRLFYLKSLLEVGKSLANKKIEDNSGKIKYLVTKPQLTNKDIIKREIFNLKKSLKLSKFKNAIKKKQIASLTYVGTPAKKAKIINKAIKNKHKTVNKAIKNKHKTVNKAIKNKHKTVNKHKLRTGKSVYYRSKNASK